MPSFSITMALQKLGSGDASKTSLIEHDVWRAEHHWSGALHRPVQKGAAMLLIGARSGLEALLALQANPDIRLFVIDASESARAEVTQLTEGRALVYGTLDEAIKNELPLDIGYCRLDISTFPSNYFDELVGRLNISHLCGEIDDIFIDLMYVYRLCSKKVDSFYFPQNGNRKSLSGRRRADVPEVSVVVPAYGVESYLPKCLASLAEQSLASLEVIVVDDGAKDNSGHVADQWAERYPGRIRVIHKENGGCASARMAGLEAARGDYVGFVDGDDWVSPRMYDDLYRSAILNDADIAQCGFYEAFDDGSITLHPTAWNADGEAGRVGLVDHIEDYLTLMPSIWRRIYRRDFLLAKKVRFPTHIRRHDDLPFAFLSISQAERMSVIPDCHYAYRLGRPGQDVEATDERLFIHLDIFDWLYANVRPWANSRIISKLLDVEIGTHQWVVNRLNPPLKRPYAKKAVAAIRSRYPEKLLRSRKTKIRSLIEAPVLQLCISYIGATSRRVLNRTR